MNRFNDSNIFSLIWQPEPVSEKITYHHYLSLINMSGLIYSVFWQSIKQLLQGLFLVFS